jgi:hypothetical protein
MLGEPSETVNVKYNDPPLLTIVWDKMDPVLLWYRAETSAPSHADLRQYGLVPFQMIT